MTRPPKKPKTPKRLYPSIKKDSIHPSDYLRFDFRSSCDDCTHFNLKSETCTLGYNAANHRKAQQIHDYELSGRLALCRFHEID